MEPEEGAACGIDGCKGVFEYEMPEDCSCHIAPPCPACLSNYLTCSICGFAGEEKN